MPASDSLQITDFDLHISDVLLVHRNTFIHLFKWNDYRTGRKVDGITYCISGRAVFDFGTSRFEVHPGQAVFLPASSSYTVRGESDEPYIHYTANFHLSPIASDSCEPTAFSEILAGNRRHLTAPENTEVYRALFEKLLSIWQSKRTGYRVMAKAILYEILYLYFTDAGRSLRNEDDYCKLLPARRSLDTAYADNQSIAELARLCAMSETHFRRLFSKLFGMSPTEYRLQKRMLRVKDLLLSGQYGISEAAREVGFSDPNYFARVFHAHEGMSPSDFIKG